MKLEKVDLCMPVCLPSSVLATPGCSALTVTPVPGEEKDGQGQAGGSLPSWQAAAAQAKPGVPVLRSSCPGTHVTSALSLKGSVLHGSFVTWLHLHPGVTIMSADIVTCPLGSQNPCS